MACFHDVNLVMGSSGQHAAGCLGRQNSLKMGMSISRGEVVGS